MKQNNSFRIHPSIGIARVGNSDGYNLAPETLTGLTETDPANDNGLVGGLPVKRDSGSVPISSSDIRDQFGALKRQAARFKIFHYPKGANQYPSGAGVEVKVKSKIDGKVVEDIFWTVHVANKKCATYVLENPNIKSDESIISAYEAGKDSPKYPPLRNPLVTGKARLKRMVIDPGPRAVSGSSKKAVQLDRHTAPQYFDSKSKKIESCDYPVSFPGDSFDNLECPIGDIDSLGTIQTDPNGHLHVAGGYGKGCSWGNEMVNDTDNDGWFDDTSDGPVTATIIFDDGSIQETEGAWVVTADPAYAPQILNNVSLWDEFYDTFVRKLNLNPDLYDESKKGFIDGFNPEYQINFVQDIGPFLQSVALQQWTTNLPDNAEKQHDSFGQLTTLKDYPFFEFIRKPGESSVESKMPLALGDSGQSFLTPTKTQYHFLSQAHTDQCTEKKQPLGPGEILDKASLMNCLGGRFSPGIDMTFTVRQKDLYYENWKETGPFRIKHKKLDYKSARKKEPFLTEGYIPCSDNSAGVEPGDTSKFMAIPWHADYNSCAVHPTSPVTNDKSFYWSWPAQRSFAVRLADEVASTFTITANSINELLNQVNSGSIGGLDEKVARQVIDDVQGIADEPFTSPENISDAISDAIGDFVKKNKEAYIDFVATEVVSSIESDRRYSVRGHGTTGSSGGSSGIYADRLDMVKNWFDIGVVLQGAAIDTVDLSRFDDKYFLEVESQLKVSGPMESVAPWPNFPPVERTLFYELQQDDIDPKILRRAKVFVDSSLEWAEQFSNGDPVGPGKSTIHPLGRFFDYTPKLFKDRLDDIYRSLDEQEEGYEPATDPLFKNRDDVIQRIIQLAPFDLMDGAWLRNVSTVGPINEVMALLFSILEDERGNGIPSMNHCNIYLDLCHDAGFYPPAVYSREFAMDNRFLDSAFTIGAFELAISQFTEEYLPEIIGMTLQLEWSVLELKNTIKLFEYYGFNPHFYRMHVGIDNAADGHGRRAVDAIELYLEQIRTTGGEEALQAAWRRIWNGYVAFEDLGTFGGDLQNLLSNPPSLHEQMIELVKDKAEYGRYNHDTNQIGARKINDWFSDPEGFLKSL